MGISGSILLLRIIGPVAVLSNRIATGFVTGLLLQYHRLDAGQWKLSKYRTVLLPICDSTVTWLYILHAYLVCYNPVVFVYYL